MGKVNTIKIVRDWLANTDAKFPVPATIAGTQTYSGTKTFSGGNTHSGANTFSGNNTLSGSIAVSGVISDLAVVPTANLSLTTASHIGRTLHMTSLSRTATLPLGTSTNRGTRYRLVNAYASTAAATELKIHLTSADTLDGGTTGVGKALQTTVDAVGQFAVVEHMGSGSWYIVEQDAAGVWATT